MRFCLCFLMYCLFCMQMNAQSLEQRIDSIIQTGIDSQAFPGCQVLILKQGNVLLHKAYGFQDYETGKTVQLSDLYDLASVTKIAGGTLALMRLYEQGLLDLDAPLRLYLPEFAGSDKDTLSLRRMLTHSAGLPPGVPNWSMTRHKNGKPRSHWVRSDSSEHFPVRFSANGYRRAGFEQRIYRNIRKAPLTAGHKYVYSDLGFYIYPLIVRNVTGMSIDSFLQQTFYTPMKLERLCYNPWQRFPLSEIVPTERDTFFRHETVRGFVHDEGAALLGGVSGHAGLFGNAWNLGQLMQMFLDGGLYQGHRYIEDSTLRLFTSYQYPEENNHRGLGFDKPLLKDPETGYAAPSASARSFGHSGFTGTFTWADPETGVVIVFLSNRVHPDRANRKLYQLGIRTALHEAALSGL
ncbi:MAG: serine hydrolase [Bacteroidetes bacterium]|nr:MAG: serine hydrolase [Bacteroidota bacterium]